MPAMVRIATAKLHIPQPKLINRPAQVLLPQPMVFRGTPMVIDAWPKETGGLSCLAYLSNDWKLIKTLFQKKQSGDCRFKKYAL
ncbi:hypothetical protein [Niabella hibiscisoli]|uniref:hypothetical protein n=1 Tax=Niabella hibiscisoli TaxID=1825928 RepID=UPI001F0CECBA|nr:hypothetical protein [Niabella hibiscisoli]MCH5718263.1 hypothetical protein [Niabella hibiscisoli]